MNKKFLSLAFLSIFAFPTYADVTGFMSAQSNFLTKGESLTDNGPALFGLITYTHDSGFYIGGDILNVDFGGDDKTRYEIDYFAGYATDISGFVIDLGYIYYTYPDSYFVDNDGKKIDYDANFGEVYLEVTKDWLKASVFYGNEAEEMVDFNNDALTVAFTATFPVSQGVDISSQIGHVWYNGDVRDDYYYYSGTVTKHTDFGDVFFTLSDTDMDGDGMKTVFGYKHYF